MSMSIVDYRGFRSGYRCGYCRSTHSKCSHGMWSHILTVQDYQDLIDRGWRRSGKYAYKPTMDETCCPQYPIRCSVKYFKLNKSHKKVIKQVNKFLKTGIRPKSAAYGSDFGLDSEENISEAVPQMMPTKSADLTIDNASSKGSASASKGSASASSRTQLSASELAAGSASGAGSQITVTTSESFSTKKAPQPGKGADPSKPICKKAKQIRLENKMNKLEGRGMEFTAHLPANKKIENQSKTLEEFLGDVSPDSVHKLQIRLCRSSPRSADFEESFQKGYEVYKKYQIAIHNDPPDKPTQRQYTRFLVDSPLEEEVEGASISVGYGSFHQQYLLDGKLIAVGVIDILPSCTSSVYLYYDPDYSFLSLGTYSALREIALTRELMNQCSQLQYYYMGFYIHSCPKMKYKSQYVPSQLLCPVSYSWCPVPECEAKLDQAKFCRFDDTGKVDKNCNVTINKTLVLYKRQSMTYGMYRMIAEEADDEAEVTQYSQLVGAKCAGNMLLYRS